MKRKPVTSSRSLSTALAVSAIALLPVLSWQFIDARSSTVVASPLAPPLLVPATTVLQKNSPTWSHKKSDRMSAIVRFHDATIADDEQSASDVDVISLDDGVSAGERGEEAASISRHKIAREQFSDWLAIDETGTGALQITDFASRKSADNRKACRAQHDAIVSGFAVERARIMADKPILFQSSICADNGEIVITCFGTMTTVSPRRTRPGSRCSRNS